MSRKLFTIGHSNLSLEEFVGLLKKHEITALADVRSHPYSRYLPHFNLAALKSALPNGGISYVFLGRELGARPDNPDCYVEGKAVYENIAATESFSQGIDRIVKGSQNYTIALMCAEKDPIDCHRTILVCNHLRQFDLDINHILRDGNLESHQQLENRLLDLYQLNPSQALQPVQLSLFDNPPTPSPSKKRSKEEALQEAYTRQGDKIAYVEKSP
ncbi:MAG: DUF488 domain-containing protein [Prochloraceae cyanobacterium]|nr:DUF488 domain-containing protein [Prochloraceae cyanobacterium]